jgi:hypothetical protein
MNKNVWTHKFFSLRWILLYFGETLSPKH